MHRIMSTHIVMTCCGYNIVTAAQVLPAIRMLHHDVLSRTVLSALFLLCTLLSALFCIQPTFWYPPTTTRKQAQTCVSIQLLACRAV